MGQGSGANSIIYLMCSDLAKGLFHKAIIQSYGMIYNNIYFSNNFSKKKYAIKMADKICGQGKNQILRLRNINAEVINNMYCLNCLSKKKVDTNKLFYPSIDGYIIKDHPFNIFKKNEQHQIPIIIGVNNDEGNLLYEIGFNKLIKNPFFDKYYNKEKLDYLKDLYNDIETNKKESMQRYFNDLLFLQINIDLAKNHSINNDVYFYIFRKSYINSVLTTSIYENDLYYLHKINDNIINIDKKTRKRFLDYWCSFIKSGNPNNIKKLLNYKLIWNNFKTTNILCFGKNIYFTNIYNVYDKKLYKHMNERLSNRIEDYYKKNLQNEVKKLLDEIINNVIILSS